MECEFKEGDEVVCIDDIFTPEYIWRTINLPKRGEKYTIRGVIIHPYADDTIPAVYLREIRNPIQDIKSLGLRREMPFAYWRFKKLDKLDKKQEKTKYNFNDLLKVSKEDQQQYEDELETI